MVSNFDMEGQIVSFRRGKRTQYTNQMIVKVDNVNNKEEASKLIKKNVLWVSPGKNKKEIRGDVKATHGNKGLVRVHFHKGMPGQSIGMKVKVE